MIAEARYHKKSQPAHAVRQGVAYKNVSLKKFFFFKKKHNKNKNVHNHFFKLQKSGCAKTKLIYTRKLF